jgi:hypothetical protein
MRKISIFAVATMLLAVATVVTSLIRGDVAADSSKISAAPAVQHVLTANGLKTRRFDAI